jgi:hypothetical protein
MESKVHAFKRRFSTEIVLTIVTGASLILATTMAGFVVLDNVNKQNYIDTACVSPDRIDSSLSSTGAAGSNGTNGVDGAAGEAGAAASPGATGATGADGTAGTTGATGATGSAGASGAAGTPGATGAPGSSGAAGSPGASGATGATGATGAPGICELSGDIVPAVDNMYSLGTSAFRWKSIQLGPGTIYMQDTNDASRQVGMTITDGSLLLDGASSLQIGNIRITATGMKAIDSASNITIGDTGDRGYLAPANGIQFPDGTVQTTAATGSGIPAGYSEYKMCIANPQNYVLFGTCEENRTHGRDIVMMSAG